MKEIKELRLPRIKEPKIKVFKIKSIKIGLPKMPRLFGKKRDKFE